MTFEELLNVVMRTKRPSMWELSDLLHAIENTALAHERCPSRQGEMLLVALEARIAIKALQEPSERKATDTPNPYDLAAIRKAAKRRRG